MKNNMKINFRRIISSGSFIPEIDGLRFIAIISVVFYHLNGFIREKDKNDYADSFDLDFVFNILERGHLGVPLFFVISGFILAMPFAKMNLGLGKKVILKDYFVRRLTRLEPPYILAMTALFIVTVFIIHKYPLDIGAKSFISSLCYVHNFTFGHGVLPLLNTVAWSLEIEIQFYLLAPLLFFVVYRIKKNKFRRAAIIFLIICFQIFSIIVDLKYLSIVNFLHYFLLGLLLADLYLTKSSSAFSFQKFNILAIITFCLIWIFDITGIENNKLKLIFGFIKLVSIFSFYYLVLFTQSLRVLAKPLITNIGGMCYSIYLLHYPIISFFGNHLISYQVSDVLLLNYLFYAVNILIAILAVSSVFFICIERPCMNKNWHKNLIVN